MACYRTERCSECGTNKGMNLTDNPHHICSDCEIAKRTADRNAHLDYLNTLPIEARIRKIEEWIYDYKPKYVPPPRY